MILEVRSIGKSQILPKNNILFNANEWHVQNSQVKISPKLLWGNRGFNQPVITINLGINYSKFLNFSRDKAKIIFIDIIIMFFIKLNNHELNFSTTAIIEKQTRS